MNPLAIVVVYMVKPENEWLLDLHLAQIARCTETPYTIYGAPNGLAVELHARLAARPEIKLLDIPPIEGSGTAQHSYYLDRLVAAAVADGAEHVAVFHVDSFPIQPGWDRRLMAELSDDCPLAAVQQAETKDFKPHASGMLFRSNFYGRYRPSFLLDQVLRSEPAYQAYQEQQPHFPDTGTGYGYALFCHGLTWRPLLRSNKRNAHFVFGGIYGDLIFHLGAAARTPGVTPTSEQTAAQQRFRARQRLRHWLRWLPAPLRRVAGHTYRRLFDRASTDATARRQQMKAANYAAQMEVRAALMQDIEGFLSYLRTGGGET